MSRVAWGLLCVVLVVNAADDLANVRGAVKHMFSKAPKVHKHSKEAAALIVDPVPHKTSLAQATTESSASATVTHTVTSTDSSTQGNNNTTTNNEEDAYARLPITITSGTYLVVEEGQCKKYCDSDADSALSELSWTTSKRRGLGYVLDVRSEDPLIGTIEFHHKEKSVTHGVIPYVFSTAAVENGTITIHPVCVRPGSTTAHVRVHDPSKLYLPVHFFVFFHCEEKDITGEYIPCPFECVHGACIGGVCKCMPRYNGTMCEDNENAACPDQCSDAGTCAINSYGVPECTCDPGRTGPSCDTVVDICTKFGKCSGHGICIEDEVCACNRDWTGLNCDVPDVPDMYCEKFDFCSGKTHGQCVESQTLRGQYACECVPGFRGPNCNEADTAQPQAVCPDSCSGQGLCTAHGCECAFGFKGDDCALAHSPCGGCTYGRCIEEAGAKPHCQCSAGWKGTKCDEFDPDSSPCKELDFCSSRGTCKDLPESGSVACDCHKGFTGKNCEQVDLDACPNKCSGHGKCDGGECQCGPTYSGADCSQPICSTYNDQMCSNHGACLGTCVCGTGFRGNACQVTDCLSDAYCHDHGNCQVTTGPWDLLCKCKQGYKGATCEIGSSTVGLSALDWTPTAATNTAATTATSVGAIIPKDDTPALKVAAVNPDELDDFLNVLP
eukprot:c19353_g1_i2.p1 GENE.c19353_g1_i2~~c19353_g1_i2.p1  ORF type:complete len:668 (+),score=94.87 c19353_g1_i2:129-2132(+)